MDFTDPAHPFEIAYFDRGPIDPKMLVLGGDWSAYWYNGAIYASEIARGLDVFQLTPTKFLTQNEIDAAKSVQVAELNVQNQQKIEWGAQLVVAKAYLDQLERSQALPASQIDSLRKAIRSAEKSHLNEKAVAKLKDMSGAVVQNAASAKSPAGTRPVCNHSRRFSSIPRLEFLQPQKALRSTRGGSYGTAASGPVSRRAIPPLAS